MRRGITLLAAVVLAAASCTGSGTTRPRFEIAAAEALFDAPLGMKLTGVRPGERVTVDVSTVDGWAGAATFVADRHGTVDPARTAPVEGDYAGVHETGLVWSMHSGTGAGYQAAGAMAVALTATVGGRRVAEARLTRLTVAPGVIGTAVEPGRDGFAGTMFQPPGSRAPGTAVLAFGGSEGGTAGGIGFARALASHGIPALGIGYFGAPGLPPTLTRIPLEYFAAALRWLARQPGVDPHRIVVLGASRGSEAALLLAVHFPDLVHGVLAAAPSSVVNPALPDATQAAWTLSGTPLSTVDRRDLGHPDPVNRDAVIPVERIAGPVMLVCGENDQLWPSCRYTTAIAARRGPSRATVVVRDPKAGHLIGTLVPDIPTAGVEINGVPVGGTREDDALARIDAWPRVLTFLGGT